MYLLATAIGKIKNKSINKNYLYIKRNLYIVISNYWNTKGILVYYIIKFIIYISYIYIYIFIYLFTCASPKFPAKEYNKLTVVN